MFSLRLPTLLLASTLLAIVPSVLPALEIPDQEEVTNQMSRIPNPVTWSASQRPTTPGIIRLVPGQSTTLPLAYYVPGDLALSGSVVEPAEGLQLKELPGGYLEIVATQSASGLYIIRSQAGLPIAFPVYVDVLPIVPFSYTPEAGKSPATVFLAGDFNGWSNSTHPLIKGEDGVYRIEAALKPGNYGYKLVVDGNWIADPSNPKTDSTGFGNSQLRVEGNAKEMFQFHFVSSVLGSDSEGKIATTLPAGEKLNPSTINVFYGHQVIQQLENRQSPEEPAWKLSDSGTEIELLLPYVANNPGNWVIVAAESEAGKLGLSRFPVYRDGEGRLPQDEVIYFAFTDRFSNGDKTNDPVATPDLEKAAPLARYQGGDWAGLQHKVAIGYFTDLGVTTLWVSPVTANTMNVEKETVEPGDFFTSYHGYWPTSSTETNPAFGTMDELVSLVQTSKNAGIAVILDFVANHVHVDHPWLKEHPEWQTPYTLPDGTKNLRLWEAQPYSTWFDTFIPTLDYEKYPEITDKQVEIANYWMDKTGIAGFRHDAVKHIPPVFWQSVTTALRKRPGYTLQIGETISDRNTIAKFVGPDKLSGQFDFPLYFTLRSVLAQGGGEMSELANSTLDSYNFYEPYSTMSPLIGNHDVSRFMAFADGDLPSGSEEGKIGRAGGLEVNDPKSYEKLKLAFAYLFSLPGAPTIYYGDEIGLTGASDPDNRRPMIWDKWTPEQTSVHETVSTLGQFRKSSSALRRGALQMLSHGKEHILFARSSADDVVLCAFLRKGTAEPIYVDVPVSWGLESLQLENMINGGAELAQGEGDQLIMKGGDSSYGYWKVIKR